MKKPVRMFFAILFSISLVQVISAQEASPSTLLYFVDLSNEPADELVTNAIVNRVVEEVTILDLSLNDEPITSYRGGSSEEVGITDIRLKTFFEDIPTEESNLVIATFYAVQGTNIFIQYNLYDPDTQIGIGGLFTRARVGLTLFSTINDAVLELGTYLEEYLENRYEYAERVGSVEQITINGRQEEIQVFFASRDVGTITSGNLVVPYTPFPIGSTTTMELRKKGYHGEVFNIALDDSEVTLELPELWPERRIALLSFWTLGLSQGAGVGAKIYLDPDNTFMYFGFHLHSATYALQNPVSINTNYDFSFLLGQYLLFPPQAFIRLSVGIGIGVIKTTVGRDLTTIKDYDDVYINLGSPTLELNFGPLQIFFRGELKYMLGVGNQLLGRNWLLTAIGIPPISLGVQVQW